MRAGADLVEPLDGRAMPRQSGPRAPDEVLVERAGAAVDVAAGHVDIGRLDVGRREDDALEERRLEVHELPGKARLDSIGVALAERFRPGAVADVELAGRVA